MSELVILDTNVVLDWVVFDDPRVRPIVDGIAAGLLSWAATAAMRAEFDWVAERSFGRRPVNIPAARDVWARHCQPFENPVGAMPASHPRCRDPSDQMYVELALRLGARWLVSRDRALLALRKRLASYGVNVVVPERWRG